MPFPKPVAGKAGSGGGGSTPSACGLCHKQLDIGDQYILGAWRHMVSYMRTLPCRNAGREGDLAMAAAGTCSACGARPFHFECVSDYTEEVGGRPRRHVLALLARRKPRSWPPLSESPGVAQRVFLQACLLWACRLGRGRCWGRAVQSSWLSLSPHLVSQNAGLHTSSGKAREKGRFYARNRPQDLFAQNRTVQARLLGACRPGRGRCRCWAVAGWMHGVRCSLRR